MGGPLSIEMRCCLIHTCWHDMYLKLKSECVLHDEHGMFIAITMWVESVNQSQPGFVWETHLLKRHWRLVVQVLCTTRFTASPLCRLEWTVRVLYQFWLRESRARWYCFLFVNSYSLSLTIVLFLLYALVVIKNIIIHCYRRCRLYHKSDVN